MKKFKNILVPTVLSIAVVFGFTSLVSVHAAANPDLGAASTFSVIAQTAITGTPTSISGDVGMNNVSSTITGVSGAVVTGTIYATDAIPVAPGEAVINPAVQADLTAAYGAIKLLPIEGTPIVTSELNGITRGPGVYDIPGNATLSGGVLTLDGAGTYIFRTDASSSLASSGTINFINGARACDLFWNIGTEANIAGSFAGTIIAHTGVHFTEAGVTLNGRALAEGADVTLNVGGSISGPTCATTPTPSSSSSSGSGIVYGCKDPAATNYNYFSSSNPELCVYAEVAVITPAQVVTPTPVAIVPKLPKTGFADRDDSHWYMNIFYYLLNLVK